MVDQKKRSISNWWIGITLVAVILAFWMQAHFFILERQRLIKEHSGYEVHQKDDLVLFKDREDAFFPLDTPKRYLGVVEGYLAIFKEPIYGKDDMERVTQIQFEQLPSEWQAKLELGRIEFDDELALLEALDSLDEYQQ